MSTTPSALSSLLSNASLNAAAWYQTVAGGNPNSAVSNVSTANLAAAEATTQTNLSATNPLLSGLLNNPSFVLFVLVAIVALVLVLRK